MKFIRPLIFLFAVIFLAPPMAHGETVSANDIINKCEDPSRALWDSGVTTEMIEGSRSHSECLMIEIEKILSKDFNQETATKILEAVSGASGKIQSAYSDLYNTREACYPSCGTMYYLFGPANKVELLEGFLKSAILAREPGLAAETRLDKLGYVEVEESTFVDVLLYREPVEIYWNDWTGHPLVSIDELPTKEQVDVVIYGTGKTVSFNGVVSMNCNEGGGHYWLTASQWNGQELLSKAEIAKVVPEKVIKAVREVVCVTVSNPLEE